MPNWCHNRLTIQSNDQSFLEDLVAAFRTNNLLSFVSPSPQPIVDADSDPDLFDAATLKKQFGVTTLRDWRLKHWGCRCDIVCDDPTEPVHEPPDRIVFEFDSAWLPPKGAVRRLFEEPRIIDGSLFYAELGNDVFGYITKYGDTSDDVCRDFVFDELGIDYPGDDGCPRR